MLSIKIDPFVVHIFVQCVFDVMFLKKHLLKKHFWLKHINAPKPLCVAFSVVTCLVMFLLHTLTKYPLLPKPNRVLFGVITSPGGF